MNLAVAHGDADGAQDVRQYQIRATAVRRSREEESLVNNTIKDNIPNGFHSLAYMGKWSRSIAMLSS